MVRDSFVSIGTQEDVRELAATVTTRPPRLSVVRKNAPSGAPQQEKNVVPGSVVSDAKQSAPIVEDEAAVSPSVRESDEDSSLESAVAEKETSSSVAREAVASTNVSFGMRLGSGIPAPVESAQEPSPNWKMIAAGLVLAAVLGGGSYFFMFMHSRGGKTLQANSAPQAGPATQSNPAAAETTVEQNSAASASQVKLNPTRASATRDAQAPAVVDARSPKSAVPPDQSRTRPSAASKADESKQASNYVSNVTSDLFGTLNAHPVAGSHGAAIQSDSLPAPDALAGSSNAPAAFPEATTSAISVPAPTEPHASVPSNSVVVPPRLISSAVAVYPEAAKAIHAEGVVTVEATINETGKVSDARAISGPAVLRQAATDALRRWKYQPGTVDGKPMTAKILVGVRFNL